MNKEGTRNYSLYVSNIDFWEISKFQSLDFLSGYSINFDDWRVIFNLINLEIFLNIFNGLNSKQIFFDSVLSDKGKFKLLNS